jgi:hypothetical protein
MPTILIIQKANNPTPLAELNLSGAPKYSDSSTSDLVNPFNIACVFETTMKVKTINSIERIAINKVIF